jgi:hypothetical protein
MRLGTVEQGRAAPLDQGHVRLAVAPLQRDRPAERSLELLQLAATALAGKGAAALLEWLVGRCLRYGGPLGHGGSGMTMAEHRDAGQDTREHRAGCRRFSTRATGTPRAAIDV